MVSVVLPLSNYFPLTLTIRSCVGEEEKKPIARKRTSLQSLLKKTASLNLVCVLMCRSKSSFHCNDFLISLC